MPGCTVGFFLAHVRFCEAPTCVYCVCLPSRVFTMCINQRTAIYADDMTF